MSVAMWNCHSWPPDVSYNICGYFISNLVLVTSCVSSGGSICLWLSWTTLNSEVVTLWSGRFNQGGPSAFAYHDQHWTVKRSLCGLADLTGGSICLCIYMFIYALVFPYIFLFVDCFEWALICHIEQRRFHSVLWQFQMGGLSLVLPRWNWLVLICSY